MYFCRVAGTGHETWTDRSLVRSITALHYWRNGDVRTGQEARAANHDDKINASYLPVG